MITARGGKVSEIKRGVVSLTGSGVVVAATVGARIKVTVYSVQSRSATMTLQFTDGNGGANLSKVMSLGANDKEIGPCAVPSAYIFATTAGTALYAVITGTGTIDIDVGYFNDDVS